jgi:hypothetical protein
MSWLLTWTIFEQHSWIGDSNFSAVQNMKICLGWLFVGYLMRTRAVRDKVKIERKKLSSTKGDDPASGWYQCRDCGQKIYYSKHKPTDAVRHWNLFDYWSN